eukprot:2085796-Pyramimonas_sp.AAC.1
MCGRASRTWLYVRLTWGSIAISTQSVESEYASATEQYAAAPTASRARQRVGERSDIWHDLRHAEAVLFGNAHALAVSSCGRCLSEGGALV